MLIGTFKSTFGAKSRLAIPKKFAADLGSKIIITKGYEGSLIMVDESRWNKLIQSFSDQSFVNNNIRDIKRFLLGSAIEIVPDKQGRFVLPDHLKDYCKLNQNAVFLGLMDWVEIWDEEIWNKKDAEISENATQVADEVSKLLTGTYDK